MKKQFLLVALISTTLLCSSCGTENNIANNEAASNDSSQSNDILQTNEESLPNTTDTTESGTQIIEDDQPSIASNAVTIESKDFEEQDTADDGTVIYSRTYNRPLVTIEGNAAAADKINADIESRIEAFTTDDSQREVSKEEYDLTLKEEGYTFFEHSESLGFVEVRSDTNVISFIMTNSGYMGGAHGYYNSFGLNYDAKTGKLLDFAALSDDADKFYNDTLEYNRELVQTDEYKERIFSEDLLDDNSLETVLYDDEKWYLSDEGLVFISNPYELGPYSSGIIEFVIPYNKLEEMGFKEGYNALTS